jgi:hypothetical protein
MGRLCAYDVNSGPSNTASWRSELASKMFTVETASFPIFRTTVQCPSPIGSVRDLRRSVLASVDGPARTNAKETEKDTGPRAPTAPFDTGL